LISLFSDLDGTLIDLAATPDGVIVPAQLTILLSNLSQQLQGRLAIATGRHIESIDRLLAPYQGAAIGIHGAIYRRQQGESIMPLPSANARNPKLMNALVEYQQKQPSLLIEDKTFAVAVHFDGDAFMATQLRIKCRELLALHQPDWHCMRGRNVIELKPANIDKGVGLQQMMTVAPFTNSTPIAIGDDTTDLDLFTAARSLGGIAVSVGERIVGQADYHLASPIVVRDFLAEWIAREISEIDQVRELLSHQ
jgi:trehalose 6-phosphate phosphatase